VALGAPLGAALPTGEPEHRVMGGDVREASGAETSVAPAASTEPAEI
jgi:hypothetical protein